MSETLVHQAIREANMKGYAHLYVIGFAIQPNARRLIDEAGAIGVPATYVQATPDLLMGDLLKSLRSSPIFSVCGLPEVAVRPAGDGRYEVELIGLDVFDPVTTEVDHRRGDDVPAWFLDTDSNGLCFHVCQAFFPRTSAWDNLKRALKGTYDDSVWDYRDRHDRVNAFVKNQGLNFGIPYLHNGQAHEYLPDFLVRLRTDPPRHLILETKGFDPLEEVKQAAAERWVAAVNADGTYGRWCYAAAKTMTEVNAIIEAACASR